MPFFINKELFDEIIEYGGLFYNHYKDDYILFSRTKTNAEVIVEGRETGYYLMRGSKLYMSKRFTSWYPRNYEYEYRVAFRLGQLIANIMIRNEIRFMTIDLKSRLHNDRKRYWSLSHHKSKDCFEDEFRRGFDLNYKKLIGKELDAWDKRGRLNTYFIEGHISVALISKEDHDNRNFMSTFFELRDQFFK